MTTKKRGLGKGLAALLPEESISDLLDEEVDKDTISNIDINLIEANINQPRKQFEKNALDELSRSIEEFGIIQPIVVRKKGEKYEIIAGERRWRAAKNAKLKSVPCIIRKTDDREAMKLALIENIQRENLNPIEEALAYKSLMEEYKLTQEELAKTIGKSRSYIANTIRLLNLDDEILENIKDGKLTPGHGRALLSISNKKERLETAHAIINDKINVRETENMAKKTKETKSKSKTKPTKDPFITDIEEKLMSSLGTKVNLIPKKRGGKIEIEFYNEEDLERIIEILS